MKAVWRDASIFMTLGLETRQSELQKLKHAEDRQGGKQTVPESSRKVQERKEPSQLHMSALLIPRTQKQVDVRRDERVEVASEAQPESVHESHPKLELECEPKFECGPQKRNFIAGEPGWFAGVMMRRGPTAGSLTSVVTIDLSADGKDVSM
ncbi:hypothetical protein PHSY_000858 [Pseudozyma hubeiensis SY62]|uniref:Uncharacterized protein n=1 Tax=Pseudozyma hubeiensis (strain SY62) TaxID=1305764 RepID=R9NXA7_PSEHS|nr:hypothetical protein PHSY_000858 [Pseudozyma hubeiensis SY62]GAC93293.1 hypothetical protein PHSY_000858 [Pseudozyma hubeiensis SY62]